MTLTDFVTIQRYTNGSVTLVSSNAQAKKLNTSQVFGRMLSTITSQATKKCIEYCVGTSSLYYLTGSCVSPKSLLGDLAPHEVMQS